MKDRRQGEKGFSVFESLLLLLLILLLILIFWFVFIKNKSNSNESQQKSSSGSSQQAANDPTADWNEYCSPVEKSCFKYPKDWTLQDDPNNSTSQMEFKQIVGPSGTTVSWGSDILGVGGACDPNTDPALYFKYVKAVPNINNLYAIGYGTNSSSDVTSLGLVNDVNGQAPQVGAIGDCIFIALFKSQDNSRQMWLSTGTLNQQDVDTVKLILGSYSY